MDLKLTDEQQWLAESVETLLARGDGWSELVAFGALTIGSDDGLGAIELCLIARALGTHLASVPFLGSAAGRLALAPLASGAAPVLAGLPSGEDSIALALLEPGCRWCSDPAATVLNSALELSGEKVSVEQAGDAVWLAVSAAAYGDSALALVPVAEAGVTRTPQPSFDPSLPIDAVTFEGVGVDPELVLVGPAADEALARLKTVGALIAAAESIGAAAAVLESARAYAAERRQFGRPIGSFQSLRHLLADIYVRQASGWSTVLYAAAAFDDSLQSAGELASIAKAYVARAAREVAHGAIQVFGGIAFTAEHPAHRFLRRIVVREQQFGNADEHERALGRALAQRSIPAPVR